jgi:hypothetical protein
MRVVLVCVLGGRLAYMAGSLIKYVIYSARQ